MGSSLFRIQHGMGLGDAVALTALVRHLRHHEPAARIELEVFPGRASLYDGLADAVFTEPHPTRPPTHRLACPLPERSYRDWPSTWLERCLIERFGLQPIDALCRYQIRVSDAHRQRARAWLDRLTAGPTARAQRRAVCHFGGVSRPEHKNVTPAEAGAITEALRDAGYEVLVWGETVPDGPPLFPLIGTDCWPRWRRPIDAGILAGLLLETDLFVGVDSGPLHLAAALGSSVKPPRAIGLWTRQSPLHCICPADHVLHLVHDETAYVHAPTDDGLAYFREHYHYQVVSDLAAGVAAACASPSAVFRLPPT